MAKRHLYWRLFRGLLANPATFTLSGGERRIPRPPRGWHARTCRNPARSIRSNSISGSSTPATCGAKCVHNGGRPAPIFLWHHEAATEAGPPRHRAGGA